MTGERGNYPCPICLKGRVVVLCCSKCWFEIRGGTRKLTQRDKAAVMLFLRTTPPMPGFDRYDYARLKGVLDVRD